MAITDYMKDRQIRSLDPKDAWLDARGISRIRFNKIIKGEIEPTVSEAIEIAKWLGVEMEELFFEKKAV